MQSKFLLIILILLKAARCSAQDQDAVIKFEDMTVTFKGMAIDPQADANNGNNVNKKSFTAWVGYKLTPGMLEIQSGHINNITVKERFETSVTLINDGQHCDLTDWRHYLSPWKILHDLPKGKYQGISLTYRDPQTQQFPTVTKDQLAEEVEKHCGAELAALLTNYKNVFTEPCAVAVSKVYLTIIGHDSRTGKAVIKNIEINVPMGD